MSSDLPKTTAVLEQGRKAGLHPGSQLYVSRNGRVVANLALGEAHLGVKMRLDTLLMWRSSTKPVLAVAIAQLWERGLLHLEDPVARFIPEFATRGKEAITLAHLLMHTAGIRSADSIPTHLPWAEILDRICRAPLEPRTRPGAQAAYHSTSTWFLLGEIVQRIDGRSCAQYMRDNIYLPLGMRDSWIGLPPEQFRQYGSRIGTMFRTDRLPAEPLPFWNTEEGCALCRPGSNGRGPIFELGLFYEAMLALRGQNNPPQPGLLKPDTVRWMTRRHRQGMVDRTFRHVLDWGLGFKINSNRYGRHTVPYGYGPHSSDETFGHSGAESSCAFADPHHSLVVAWACNGLPGEPAHQARIRALNTAIYEDLGLAP
jgi:CubicO group peptidase (beta-lactamase class C family)